MIFKNGGTISLSQWFWIQAIWAPGQMSGDSWVVSNWGVLLAFRELNLWMLLNIPWCTGQLPHKGLQRSHVDWAEVEKLSSTN